MPCAVSTVGRTGCYWSGQVPLSCAHCTPQAPCEGLSCTANTLDALKQLISDRWCVPLPPATPFQRMLPFHRRLITVVEYIAPVSAVIAAPAVGVYRHAPGMSFEASSDPSCKFGRHAVLRDIMACALTSQRAQFNVRESAGCSKLYPSGRDCRQRSRGVCQVIH